MALTWGLSRAFAAGPSPSGASPAAVAASFVLDLGVLGVVLAWLPLKGDLSYGGWRTWLRGTLLALAAAAGLWVGARSGLSLRPPACGVPLVPWQTAGALAALMSAQTAVLCGLHGLLTWLCDRQRLWARATLLLCFTLAGTSLFWSRPLLYAVQTRSIPAYEVATQAVVTLNPVMNIAALWNAEPAGFDLVRTPHTYRIWIGANFLAYPRLWPSRAPAPYLAADAPWTPGLVLTLFVWGIVVTLGCDYLAFLSGKRWGVITE
jgi:hypothetical protein